MSESRDFSRRVFLRAIGLGTAGLAIGGGAAWASNKLAEQATLQATLGDLQTQLAQSQTSRLSLDGTVTTLQGQVTTLDAQLAATTGQNAQLASALADSQNQAQTLQQQLTEAQARIAQAESRVSQLGALVGLYDQLEAVGLDGLAQDGLRSAAAGIATALGLAPMVRGGLEMARGLLADFEQVLPDFHTGLTWLGDQMIKLKLDLYALEKVAQKTLKDAATGVVAVFGGFIKFVLDYLPFDVGEKTRAALNAAQALIAQTIDLTDQSDKVVFEKMSRYVSGGPNSWQTKLVTPLRDQALSPTDNLVTAVDGASQTFETALNAPVQNALAQRAALRDQIAAYRAAHQL